MLSTVKFVEKFKDGIIIPLAKENLLDKDLCYMALEEYLNEIYGTDDASKVFEITTDNEFKVLHPYHNVEFELKDRKWPTIEHYYQACLYFDVDNELVENILKAETPEIAHRRGKNAALSHKMKRPDWEAARLIELEKAYRQLFKTYPDYLPILKKIGNGTLLYIHPTDVYLGCSNQNDGQNLLGKLLMKLSKEL